MENNENLDLDNNQSPEMEVEETILRVPYEAATESCNTLEASVPIGFASEQMYFNNKLKSIHNVAEYVKTKLQYPSIEKLCEAFAKEQIDGIATALYNWETTGKAIIISDQTGLGKGRMIAGLIRYSILTLKKFPVFFTEGSNLFSDIYRDLYDVGLEANIPIAVKTKPTILDRDDITKELVINELKKDIKKQDLRIDYQLPEEVDLTEEDLFSEENDEVLQEIIELYFDHIAEEGIVMGKEHTYLADDLTDRQIKNIIKKDIEENNSIRFAEIELTQNQIDDLFESKYDKILNNVINLYRSKLSVNAQTIEAKKEGRYRIQPIAPFELDILNKAGDKLYEISGNDVKKLLTNLQIDAKYEVFSVLCLKYTTISKGMTTKDGKKSPKALFIEKMCNDRLVLLDEVHNAAGSKSKVNKRTGQPEASNTFKNLSFLIRNAKFVTYISATWAKRADNIPIYALKTAIQDSKLSTQQLITAFDNGGLALQEVVSSALVKDGQLIRREKDVKAEIFIPQLAEDSTTALNQMRRIGDMASIWSQMMSVYKGLLEEFRDVLKNEFVIDGEGFSDEQIRLFPIEDLLKIVRRRYKLSGNLSTQLSRLFEYFLIALKVNQSINAALDELKQGRKVVIAVSNTFASQFDNIRKNYEANIKYDFGDYIPNDLVEMFKGQTARLLGFTYNGVQVLDDGSVTQFKAEVDLMSENLDNYDKPNFRILINALTQFKQGLIDTINNFSNIDVPFSPLDVITAKIKSQGYSIDEITGRTRKLVFEKNEYVQGIYTKRVPTDKMVLVNQFNRNELDALIINVSGATGLSLHALETIEQGKIVPPVNVRPAEPPKSLEPRNEVKARTMIILQMEKDIAKEMQKLGRINRNGQAFIPRYIYINSIIPSEARYNAMAQKKLKSLMSITAGNQEFGKDIFNYDDFLSEYGVMAWNETIKELKYPDDEYKVKKADDLKVKSKRLYFLDYDEQKQFYDTLKRYMLAIIEQAIANGSYTTKIEYENYLATTSQVVPFIVTSSNTPTIFGSHVFAEVIKIKKLLDVNSELSVTKAITDKYERYDYSTQSRRTLEMYQQKEKDFADKFVIDYVSGINNLIADQQEGIVTLEAEIVANDEKLKNYPDIQEIVTLEENIVQKQNEKSQLGKSLLELAEKGESTEQISRQVASLSTEIELLTNKKNEKSANQTSKELQQVRNSIERQLNYAFDGIEKRKNNIERFKQDINEQEKYLALYKKFVDNIGNLIEIETFEEVRTLVAVDENNDEIYEYKYTPQSTEKYVLISVNYDFNNNTYFKLSEMRYSAMGVTSNYGGFLSKAFKEISALGISRGMKHTENITMLNVSYKEGWTEIVNSFDASYYQQEVVLSGDLLKATAFKYYLNLSGKIVKYTTSDNRLKTSLFLSEQSKKEIENLVTEIDTKDDNAVLYSLSIDNLKNISSAVVGRRIFYSLSGFRDNIQHLLREAEYGKISSFTSAMQLFYDSSRVFLIAYPSVELLEKINDYISSQNINTLTFNEDEPKEKLIRGIIKVIYENFEGLRYILTSQNDRIISAFYDIAHNKLGVPKSEVIAQSDFNTFNLINSDDSASLNVAKQYDADGEKFVNDPISLSAYETTRILTFKAEEDNGLYEAVYIIEKTLKDERKNSTKKSYFSMLYNLSLTANGLTTICDYLGRGLNVEMLCTASIKTLEYSSVPYVFNLESSSKGLIEQIAIPDNVGDKRIESIETIIDEFVKFYLNN